jgi:hypothetical protein
MSKPIAWAGAAAALLLAACGDDAPEADDRMIEVTKGAYQAKLEAMPAATRDATLLRAIRDAGRDCQRVEGSRASGKVNDAPTWTATCENGVQWTVVIGRDGIAQVVSTADLLAATARKPRT